MESSDTIYGFVKTPLNMVRRYNAIKSISNMAHESQQKSEKIRVNRVI